VKLGTLKPGMHERILRAACLLALLAIALMVWALLVPTPMPVMVAMSLGQAFGTLSLLAYLYVVVVDLLRTRRERLAVASNTAGPRAP
jgi:hypothetical protein